MSSSPVRGEDGHRSQLAPHGFRGRRAGGLSIFVSARDTDRRGAIVTGHEGPVRADWLVDLNTTLAMRLDLNGALD